MRGHIRRRGNAWCVVVDAPRGEDGRRRQTWRSGYRTRKDAQRALTELLGRLEGGRYIEPINKTLGQHLAEWLVGLRTSGLRPSTISGYEMFVTAHIVPALGMMPLQKLATGQLNAFYVDLLERGRRTGKGRGGQPLDAHGALRARHHSQGAR